MEWITEPGLLDYETALARMAERVASIQRGEADELAWLVEHPPLYTLGTSAKAGDILPLPSGEAESRSDSGEGMPGDTPPSPGSLALATLSRGERVSAVLPTYTTGRGGQVTYHGPGQRVVYVMRDLKKHAAARGEEPDLRAYVKQLEHWIILTLRDFGVEGFTRDGRVGVWVEQQVPGSGFRVPGGEASRPSEPSAREAARSIAQNVRSAEQPKTEAKIAALGVRVQKWVTSHGIALNVNPDLSHYAGIVPCGIREFGVTSLAALGVEVGMAELDAALRANFGRVFG